MALITIKKSGPRNAATDPETGLRFYSWNGEKYPSVTSIRRLAGLPYNLANWQVNQVIQRAIVESDTLSSKLKSGEDKVLVEKWLRKATTDERDRAADVGTRVHEAAATKRKPSEVEDDIRGPLIQYYDWLIKSKADVVAAESQVFALDYGYAGSLDLMCKFPTTDGTWLVDIKTGKGTYPEAAMQLSAYQHAEFIGADDVVDDVATSHLRDVKGTAILHLRPDGWSFKVMQNATESFIAFLALLSYSQWAIKYPAIDGLTLLSKDGAA